MKSAASKDDSIPHNVYSKMFDECMTDAFSKYYVHFSTMFYAASGLQVVLSAVTALIQTPNIWSSSDTDVPVDHSVVFASSIASAGCAFVSTIIGSLIHISKLQSAATQCNQARMAILYHKSSKKPMPRHVFDSIHSAETLWYPHPMRCRAAAPS